MRSRITCPTKPVTPVRKIRLPASVSTMEPRFSTTRQIMRYLPAGRQAHTRSAQVDRSAEGDAGAGDPEPVAAGRQVATAELGPLGRQLELILTARITAEAHQVAGGVRGSDVRLVPTDQPKVDVQRQVPDRGAGAVEHLELYGNRASELERGASGERRQQTGRLQGVRDRHLRRGRRT